MYLEHNKVGLESHRSNGIFERIIRTLRKSIMKSNKVYEAIKTYNLSFHVGLECTPIEAEIDDTEKVMLEISPQGKYARQYRSWYRKSFY